MPYIKGSTIDTAMLREELKQYLDGYRTWIVISHDYERNRDHIRGLLETRCAAGEKRFAGAWLYWYQEND